MKELDLNGEDLKITLCAREECVAGKKVDFYAHDERHYYALHYITHGNGALQSSGDKEEILKPGDLFIIPPNKDVSYRTIDRWEYFWINIEGRLVPTLLKAIGLTDESLILGYKRDMNVVAEFTKLVDCYYKEGAGSLNAKGHFYLLMGTLYNDLHNKKTKQERRNTAFYIKEAITFLEYNFYYASVTLDSLAKNLAVNKNYLCTIFKREMGVSPMQYLIDIRMKAAAKRLIDTTEPIAAVAQYVGYKDPLYFSKEFKRHHGVTPSDYRETGGAIAV